MYSTFGFKKQSQIKSDFGFVNLQMLDYYTETNKNLNFMALNCLFLFFSLLVRMVKFSTGGVTR